MELHHCRSTTNATTYLSVTLVTNPHSVVFIKCFLVNYNNFGVCVTWENQTKLSMMSIRDSETFPVSLSCSDTSSMLAFSADRSRFVLTLMYSVLPVSASAFDAHRSHASFFCVIGSVFSFRWERIPISNCAVILFSRRRIRSVRFGFTLTSRCLNMMVIPACFPVFPAFCVHSAVGHDCFRSKKLKKK